MITYELKRKTRIALLVSLIVISMFMLVNNKYDEIGWILDIFGFVLFTVGLLMLWSTVRSEKYSEEHGEVYKASAANDIKYLQWLAKQGVDFGGDQGKIALQMLVNDHFADTKYNGVVRFLLIRGARLEFVDFNGDKIKLNHDYGFLRDGLFSKYNSSCKQNWFSEEHFKKYVDYYGMLLKYHDDKFNERVITYLKSEDIGCTKLLEELIKRDDYLAEILNRLSSSER